MTFVITQPCIDVQDQSCVEVCPVDCIHYEDDDRMLYIEPEVCIDCGACEPACPVSAIFAEADVPEDQAHFLELNADLSRTWPVLTEKIDAPEDAADWEWVEGKLAHLER